MAQLIVIQKSLPALKRSGRASIVNVASIGALTALPLMSIYCASKAAVLGLSRAVATELAPHIRCNVICPGGIDTSLFLISDESSFLTGSVVPVDGGVSAW